MIEEIIMYKDALGILRKTEKECIIVNSKLDILSKINQIRIKNGKSNINYGHVIYVEDLLEDILELYTEIVKSGD